MTTDERGGKPSASGMERFVNCPGSWAAELGMPPLPVQVVTEEGSEIHSALETGGASSLAEDKAQIVSNLKNLEFRAAEDWVRSVGPIASQHSRFAETRLWIRDRRTLELVASAQLDIFYLAPPYSLIIDAKTGFKAATSSERNWQLVTQALAVWHENPAVEYFRVAIAASRLGSSLDVAEYTKSDLMEAERELLHALWRSRQPNAPRTPGSWCQYCRAKSVCPQAASYSLVVLQEVEHRDNLVILEAVQRMTPPQLAEVFKRSKIATQIFDAIEARLKAMTPVELEGLGLKLKPGSNKTKVVDFPVLWETVAVMLNENERLACASISIPKVVDTYAKKNGLTKKQAEEAVGRRLGTLIEKVPNQPSLAIV